MRVQADLSLREMASQIGVDISTLSRWETGTTVPRAGAALRWAAALLPLAMEAGSHPPDKAPRGLIAEVGQR